MIIKDDRKSTYFEQVFDKNKNNPKNQWKTINCVLGKNPSTTDLQNNCSPSGGTITDSLNIADEFHSFFLTIPDKLIEDLDSSD